MIGLFCLLAYRGFRVALAAPDTFGGLLAAGITAWLCLQAFVNIGVVVTLLPVTGITLPFVSAGGSSLIVSLVAAGILLSVSRETAVTGGLECEWRSRPAVRAGTSTRPSPSPAPFARARRRLSSPGSAGGAAWRPGSCRRPGSRSGDSSLRSLRSAGRDVHVVLDPLRLAASVPQALWLLARRRPDAVFTTGGYVAIPVMLAARLLRIPVVLWDGNVVPGRSVRATARLAGAVAVTDPRPAPPSPRAAATRPGRRSATRGRSTTRRPASSWASRPRAAPARLRRLAGGPPLQCRRGRGAAPARRTLHGPPRDGRRRYADALAAREALPEERRARYRPVPFLADDMTAALASADLVVGRAGSSTLAECAAFGLPLLCVPYPHAAGHQRRERGGLRGDRRRAPRRGRGLRRGGAARRPSRLLEDPAAHLAMSAAARSAGPPRGGRRGRGARRRRRRAPAAGRTPAEIAALAAGTGAADGRPAAPFDAVRVGTEIQRRSGSRRRATSRWPASRRCGWADRPISTRPSTTSSSCAAS